MAEPAVIGAEPTTPQVAPEPSLTPVLDSYMNGMRPQGQVAVQEPPAAEAPAAPATSAPPSTEAELAPKLGPAPPAQAPSEAAIAAEVEQRAQALLRSQQERWQAEQQQRITQEAQAKAAAEFDAQLEKATSGDDFDAEVQEARRWIANHEALQRQRQRWSQEALGPERQRIVGELGSQYERAIQRIPELAGNAEAYDWRRYQSADDMLVAIADRVRAESTAEIERRAHELAAPLAERQAIEKLAEARATMPSPDLTPAASGSGGPGYFRSVTDVEAAYIRNEASAADVRHVRALQQRGRLPYDHNS